MESAVNGMKTPNLQPSTANVRLAFIRPAVGGWALKVPWSRFPINQP